MGFGGAMVAMSAVQGITSISSGYAQSAETKYNASLYSDQAQILGEKTNLIQLQGDIAQGQLQRQGGQLLATSTARAGAAGLEPTGSVAAAMLDAQTQIHTDMAIAKFNTQMDITNNETAIFSANQSATNLRQQAKMQVAAGYTGAFSDMLTGAMNYAMYTGKVNTSTYGGAMPESTMG